MRQYILIAGAALVALMLTTVFLSYQETRMQSGQDDNLASQSPPVAVRVTHEIEQVGRVRNDPYQWLKDDNWQQLLKEPSGLRADIKAYLEAENAYTKTRLEEPVTALTEELFSEMRGRIKEDDASLPEIDGPYAYLSKYRTGGEYPIFARRPAKDIYNPDTENEIILDGDELGKNETYFSFGEVVHSPDHKLIAYSVDTQGSEYYDIYFKNIETGELLPDRLIGGYGEFVWGKNSDRIYWIERNEEGRPTAIHMYVLGIGTSEEIYRETDPGYFLGVDVSQSGEFIFLRASDHTTSEYRFFRSDTESPEPVLIAAREPGVEYTLEHAGDQFVIMTNRDNALDYKLVTAPVAAPEIENWEDLVPHQPGTLILDMAVVDGFIIRLQRTDGLPKIIIRTADGDEREIGFQEAAYDLDISVGYEYNTSQIRFTYSSPTTPDQTYDYDLRTDTRQLRKTQEVPSGHTIDDYRVERVMVPARDGETVPVTIFYHKTTARDGTAPLLLYGYGSYGITITPDFRTTPLALVNRGMIYATVHSRGSMAKGYQWYLDGKLENKINTFNDYIDAAHFLIDNRYTSTGQIVGMGGSAGGMLMGAVVNQAPELFAGIIAAVPFVDVLNTMSDTSLPLTPPEWPEWGNPITSPEDYDYIHSYSPYDQVADRAYPPMLITGGLTDPRVTYWEPAKWTAQLRHEAPMAGPYFLKINMGAGHGGASGRFEGLKETALEYAFALAAVGKLEGFNLEQ